MSAFPPSPFPRKGAIMVPPQERRPVIDSLPPWGGPTEAA